MRIAFARKLAEQLTSGPLTNKVAILQRMLSRIVVYDDRISIGFRLDVLGSSSRSSVIEESTIPIDVPVKLKRCGMAVRLITLAPGVQHRGPDQTPPISLFRSLTGRDPTPHQLEELKNEWDDSQR